MFMVIEAWGWLRSCRLGGGYGNARLAPCLNCHNHPQACMIITSLNHHKHATLKPGSPTLPPSLDYHDYHKSLDPHRCHPQAWIP